MSKRLTLVLGGARAGKSTYAQRLAEQAERVLFVATAEALDEDMTARIRAHQESRPPEWDTLEEPLEIVQSMKPLLSSYDTVLLDCLTLWVSNLLLRDMDCDVPSRVEDLLRLYRQQDASWIVVSNEVGLGIVAPTKLGRVYADELGRVNQMIAAEADEVIFMAAGLPLTLKSGHPAD
ncbi:MAG: bifunctional adenosylcobinamide kinase/adenosylcobinamide-phosphate guanylyltransferase [Chloroflexi bacterium]|nr:bifunctional adenosylcobinamide kinase/adenosylcobinamide-phosphate guanylyltransferase [Chloroflexota bacterium]